MRKTTSSKTSSKTSSLTINIHGQTFRLWLEYLSNNTRNSAVVINATPLLDNGEDGFVRTVGIIHQSGNVSIKTSPRNNESGDCGFTDLEPLFSKTGSDQRYI